MILTASTADWTEGRAGIDLASLVGDFVTGLSGAIQHLLDASHNRRFLTGADPDRLVIQDRLDELPGCAGGSDVRDIDVRHLLLTLLVPVEGERLQAQPRPRAEQPGPVR